MFNFIIIPLLVSVGCLIFLYPYKIQNIALRIVDSYPKCIQSITHYGYIRSKLFVYVARLIGITMFVLAVMLLIYSINN